MYNVNSSKIKNSSRIKRSPLYTHYPFLFIKGKHFFFTENSFRIKQTSLYKHYPFLFLKGKRVLEWKHLFVLVCNGCYCAVWHNLRIVYWLSLESSIAIFFLRFFSIYRVDFWSQFKDQSIKTSHFAMHKKMYWNEHLY